MKKLFTSLALSASIILTGCSAAPEAPTASPATENPAASSEAVTASPDAALDYIKPEVPKAKAKVVPEAIPEEVVPEVVVPTEPAPEEVAPPAPEPVVTTEPPAVVAPPEPESVVYSSVEWVYGVLASRGIAIPANTTYEVTDAGNCGGPGGGCASVYRQGDVIFKTEIRISPSAIGHDGGVHVVLHETAHALGITDECAAEAFAHQYGSTYWGYPECATAQ